LSLEEDFIFEWSIFNVMTLLINLYTLRFGVLGLLHTMQIIIERNRLRVPLHKVISELSLKVLHSTEIDLFILYQAQDWRNIQNQLKDKQGRDEALNIELI